MTIFRGTLIALGTGGEALSSTLHLSSSGSLASVNTAWNAFCTGIFTGALAARWSTAVSLEETVTDQLDPTTGKNVAQLRQANIHAGTATDKPQSPRDCVVVSLRTATPTRAGRGRMFWPAPTVASTDGAGKLTDAARTAFSTAFAAALGTLGATATPVVYHRPTVFRTTYNRKTGVGTDHAASVATAIPIIVVSIGNKLGTMRSRDNQTSNSYLAASI
jgi:hypothetical protein